MSVTVLSDDVINAGDGAHQHPTQALLDALTMRLRLGIMEGMLWGLLPRVLGVDVGYIT